MNLYTLIKDNVSSVDSSYLCNIIFLDTLVELSYLVIIGYQVQVIVIEVYTCVVCRVFGHYRS